MLTLARLKELLHYDPETGVFTRVKSVMQFKKGTVAGTVNYQGRRKIVIDGHNYHASRLAWLYITGEWPKDQIDHKDLDRGNDKWENLRQATQFQNMQNRTKQKHNTTGYKGVFQLNGAKTYYSRITANGKRYNLGTYATARQAANAYASAASIMHRDFCNVETIL